MQYIFRTHLALRLGFILLLSGMGVSPVFAQDDGDQGSAPVRSTFASTLIIDNQTVEVPLKGTFQFDIQHRFGTFENGFNDLYGLYAASNIRLGFGYSPIQNLSVGFGLTKQNMLLDLNAKYAILKQTRTWSIPVSLTYFGNATMDTRPDEENTIFYHDTDRWSYFHQLIIGCKLTSWLSFQVAPSVSHFNLINEKMSNDHYALAFSGRVHLYGNNYLIANVDQPLTSHKENNPNPNLSLGIEFNTSSHAFQVFIGNYNAINPQFNNVFNDNNYLNTEDDRGVLDNFLIGFNITRLWNF